MPPSVAYRPTALPPYRYPPPLRRREHLQVGSLRRRSRAHHPESGEHHADPFGDPLRVFAIAAAEDHTTELARLDGNARRLGETHPVRPFGPRGGVEAEEMNAGDGSGEFPRERRDITDQTDVAAGPRQPEERRQ